MAVVVIIVVVVVAVAVTLTKKNNSYPDYSVLNYNLQDTCKFVNPEQCGKGVEANKYRWW